MAYRDIAPHERPTAGARALPDVPLTLADVPRRTDDPRPRAARRADPRAHDVARFLAGPDACDVLVSEAEADALEILPADHPALVALGPAMERAQHLAITPQRAEALADDDTAALVAYMDRTARVLEALRALCASHAARVAAYTAHLLALGACDGAIAPWAPAQPAQRAIAAPWTRPPSPPPAIRALTASTLTAAPPRHIRRCRRAHAATTAA